MSKNTTKTSANTSSMQLTQEQKEKFLSYLEMKGLPAPKQDGSTAPSKSKTSSEFEVFSIDYIGMCVEDIISKISKLDSYISQNDEQKEYIEINMKLEFIDTLFNKVTKLFEENEMSGYLEDLGKNSESVNDLMETFVGLIATVPDMAEFSIKTIIQKYKDLCDEMELSYNPNIIYSLISENA